MRALTRRLVLVLCLGVARPVAALVAGQPEVRIVANPDVPVAELTREQVSRLFLKKVPFWSNGVPVAPVDLDEGAQARAAFSQRVHRRSVDMLTRYWQRQIFAGRETPPPTRRSDEEVLAYVRTTPGAIGYVSSDAPVHGVRVLSVHE